MEIRIRETEQILSDFEFRLQHENVSFPAVLSKELLDEYGADAVLHAPAPTTDDAHQAVRDGVEQDSLGNWVHKWIVIDKPFVPPTVEQYTQAVQNYLDSKAQEKRYDNIVSACSYAGAPNPFQEEGQMFLSWRGNVWALCYAIMAEVQSGVRQPPTIQELINELPVLE